MPGTVPSAFNVSFYLILIIILRGMQLLLSLLLQEETMAKRSSKTCLK